jgi:NitT/TauT family transport system permease protein
MPKAFVREISGTAGLIALAELVSRAHLVPALPPASHVLTTAVSLLGDREFRTGVAATLGTWAGGLGAAVVVAVPLGVLLGSRPAVEVATRPLVGLCRRVPAVAAIPLAITVLGAGASMRITLAGYAACWPILIHTVSAVGDDDPVTSDTMRVFGIAPRERLWWVALPRAAPLVFTGVRVAAPLAMIVTIGAELLSGGTHGIGAFLAESQRHGDHPATLLAGALWAGLLGLGIDIALSRAGRRLFRRYPSPAPASEPAP